MYCQNCGSENKDDAKFCQRCGCELIEIVASKKESVQNSHKSNKKTKKLIPIFIVGLSLLSVLLLVFVCSGTLTNNESPPPIEAYLILNDYFNDEYSDVEDCVSELNKIAKKTANSKNSDWAPFYYNVIDAFDDKNQKQSVALATIELYEYISGENIEDNLDYPEDSALTYSFGIEFRRLLLEIAYS